MEEAIFTCVSLFNAAYASTMASVRLELLGVDVVGYLLLKGRMGLKSLKHNLLQCRLLLNSSITILLVVSPGGVHGPVPTNEGMTFGAFLHPEALVPQVAGQDAVLACPSPGVLLLPPRGTPLAVGVVPDTGPFSAASCN